MPGLMMNKTRQQFMTNRNFVNENLQSWRQRHQQSRLHQIDCGVQTRPSQNFNVKTKGQSKDKVN
jgi:hypothetical protein